MKDRILVGDLVKIIRTGYHASAHRWNNNELPLVHRNGTYIVQDVDYNFSYLNGYVIKVGGRAYGSEGVEVINSVLDNARRIIYE